MAVDVKFDASAMHVRLLDGREVGIPLAWFPKLQHATPAQRKRWRLIGKGVGIHWDVIDEDLSVSALLGR
ncbi:MAG: DUF2442 domain-containing protein [Candidatus Coatesbacteria bacterium]